MALDFDHEDISEEWKTTVFPVSMYKVSREWIFSLFNEMKRTVMTKAISSNCSKQFLASLNELELKIGDDAKISVNFSESLNLANLYMSELPDERATIKVAPVVDTPPPPPPEPPKPKVNEAELEAMMMASLDEAEKSEKK